MNKNAFIPGTSHNRLLTAYTAQLQRERYSRQTVRNYTNHFIRFLHYFGSRVPADLSAEDVHAYIQHQRTERNLSDSTVNVLSYSIRYYYERVLNSPEHVMSFSYRRQG